MLVDRRLDDRDIVRMDNGEHVINIFKGLLLVIVKLGKGIQRLTDYLAGNQIVFPQIETSRFQGKLQAVFVETYKKKFPTGILDFFHHLGNGIMLHFCRISVAGNYFPPASLLSARIVCRVSDVMSSVGTLGAFSPSR
jgi:hypothetical protein